MPDYKSGALPSCATGALAVCTWRISAPSQPSCRPPAFPRSPTALPRPDSHRGSRVQGAVGLAASPRGYGRPAPIRTGTSSPSTRCACQLRHGAVSQRRRRAKHAARDGVAQRPKTKTNGIPDPLQRILAALPFSSVANRCWDSTRPDGFRNAIRIIATRPKELGLFADFGVDRKLGHEKRAREDLNPDLTRSKRAVLSGLHHMPDAPERN